MPNRRLNLTGLDIIRGFFRLIVISFVFLPFLSDIWADRFLAKDAGEPGFRNKIFRFFARRIVKKRVLHGIDLIKKRAVRLREILIKLGPAFIKIGQAMATRPDLVPVPYLKELEKLQDDVPPFSNRRARKIIEKDLKTKIKVIFPEMEESPVAAASLGQVYRARLREGTWVAVKVQRPGIARLLRKDFAALRILAGFAEKRKAIGLGINWTDAVNDFYVMISQEMNYRQEVENARTFRKNFASWKDIHVPRIYSEYSGNRTITMEFIDGIKLNDREGLTAQGVEPMEAIEIVTRSYLKQLIEDGFFSRGPASR